MVVAHDLGHVSSSGFDCSRSCRVHMTECAQNPSFEDVLCHEMLHCAFIDKRSEIDVDAAMFVCHLECWNGG